MRGQRKEVLCKNFVFDLDDTLFKELDWVKSALKHCSDIVSELYSLDSERVYTAFIRGLNERGRGQVFYKALEKLGIPEPEAVKQYLIYRYRTHKPQLELPPEVRDTLLGLKTGGCKLGIITDGVLSAQMNKVEALGLDKIVDATLYTEVLGYESRKPSVLPFQVMKFWLGEGEFYYVGDNPERDFTGANIAEYHTVMLKSPKKVHRLTSLPIANLPEKQIDRFEDLLKLLNL